MHNASVTVRAVVESFLDIDELSLEVIVVDDCSTDDSIEQVESLGSTAVTVLRSDRPGGAGAARNRGFERVTGTYTLFFDADDEIHADTLVASVAALEGSGADLTFHPYRYRRGDVSDYDGMNVFDRTVWSDYAKRFNHVITLGEVPRLLGFSNYPWNKVIRTERFRQTGLVYGHTPVHNDILGHWMSLLNARTVLLLDQTLCTHIVETGGANLTNRTSVDRLTVFDALDETYSFLERNPTMRSRFAHHYWDFALRVSGWARGRLDKEHRNDFQARLQNHLLRMDLADYTSIRTKRDPELADLILTRAIG